MSTGISGNTNLYGKDRQLVSIYKSPCRDEMYLYVHKRDQFEQVPELLMEQFGAPEHVMDLLLTKKRSLARADVEKVMRELQLKGFYLQMPPEKETFLDELKVSRES